MFTYDSRYYYCSLLGPLGKKKQQKIFKKRIDLENITDFKVTCRNYSRDIYGKALKELLGVKSKIKDSLGNHYWLEFKENDKTIMADATRGDLTWAKMKSRTRYYGADLENDYDQEELKRIDQKINYIDKDYEDSFWMVLLGKIYYEAKGLDFPLPLCPKTPEEQDQLIYYFIMNHEEIQKKELTSIFSNLSQNTLSNFQDKPSEDILVKKWDRIQEAFSHYQNLSKSNQVYATLTNFEDAKTIIKEFQSRLNLITPQISLFQDYDNKEWDFMKLYPVHLRDESLYFALEKKKKEYSFHQVLPEDAIAYTKQLKGVNKQLVYRR